MKHDWDLLLESLWPSRSGPPIGRARRMALLQAVIALAIAVAWGPEIFAAMEMTALLEMLGASLFLTAYAAGLNLKAIELRRALRNIVLPVSHEAVLRSNASASSKALASLSVAANAAACLCAVFVAGAYGHYLLNS